MNIVLLLKSEIASSR